MLVMIDGVSLQSSRSISRQLDSIDPFNIDRIEVLSGSTSVYGAGATGDDLDYKVAQAISGGNDTLSARVSAVYTETQGFYDAEGEIVTPDIFQGSLQYNKTIDLQTTVDVTLSDTKSIKFLAQYYDSQQDSPYGLYIVGRDIDVRKGFESDRQHGTERIMLSSAYNDSDLTLKVQSQTMFDYKGADDSELDGYTVFDLLGSYELPVGSIGFGVQNLFDKDYTTAWGQRAQIFYAAHYDAAAYDYKGRGRTYTLNYQVKY